MPWIMAAVAVVGWLAGGSDRKRAKKAAKRKAAMLEKLTALADESAARGRGYLDTYERDFMPVAREAVDAARQVGRPDFAAINADNATAFQNQADAMTRSMQRAGVNPLDGAWASAVGDVKNNEAASLVLNRNSARRGAAVDRYQALSGAAGLGAPVLGAGQNLLSSAGAGYSNAAGGYAETQRAATESAAATANAVGQVGGGFAGAYGKGGTSAPMGGKSKIPWNNFVQKPGSPQTGNMVPTGAGVPGYVNPTSNTYWWNTGGR